jgi:hypothetical protein
MQGSLQRIRANNKATEQRMASAACQLAGGAIGGVLDGKLAGGETHTVLGVPTALTGGIILAAVGVMDLVPGAEYVGSIGLGSASYGLGNLVRTKLIPSE